MWCKKSFVPFYGCIGNCSFLISNGSRNNNNKKTVKFLLSSIQFPFSSSPFSPFFPISSSPSFTFSLTSSSFFFSRVPLFCKISIPNSNGQRLEELQEERRRKKMMTTYHMYGFNNSRSCVAVDSASSCTFFTVITNLH